MSCIYLNYIFFSYLRYLLVVINEGRSVKYTLLINCMKYRGPSKHSTVVHTTRISTTYVNYYSEAIYDYLVVNRMSTLSTIVIEPLISTRSLYTHMCAINHSNYLRKSADFLKLID